MQRANGGGARARDARTGPAAGAHGARAPPEGLRRRLHHCAHARDAEVRGAEEARRARR